MTREPINPRKVSVNRRSIIRFLIKLVLFCLVLVLVDRGLSAVFLRGLSKYFGLDKPSEYLFIGHSQTVLGINKDLAEKELGGGISVYAREGAGIRDREVMLKQYFNRFPGHRPVVLYDVNARLFVPSGLSDNSYILFYPFMGDRVVDDYLTESQPDREQLWIRNAIHLTRYNDVTIRFAIRGWSGFWGNLKTTHIDPAAMRADDLRRRYGPITIDPVLLESFRRTIRLCDSAGVTLDLLYFPNLPSLTNEDTAAYSRAIDIFEQADSASHKVHFHNYNYLFTGQTSYFFDPIHLNKEGQSIFTHRLVEDLKNDLTK